MPILTLANPNGGRPLNNMVFQVDAGLSKMVFKLGYIKCEHCDHVNGIAVDKEHLELFIKSDYNTLSKNKPSVREKVSGWLSKTANKVNPHVTEHTPRHLPNGQWIS